MLHKQTFEGFTGSIEMRMLKFKERLDAIKSLNVTQNDGEIQISTENLEKFEKLVEIVKKQISKVDLTHKKSKTKFENLDDLEYYAEYTEVVNVLSGILLNGVSLGNV